MTDDILDKRPVISAVCRRVVLDYLVICSIIGIFAYPAGKFGMVGIDTSIYHGYGNAVSAIILPCISDIEIAQIILQVIAVIGYAVVRRCRRSDILLRNFVYIRYACLVVWRYLREICAIFLVGAYISDAHALRQSKRGIFTVGSDSQSRSESLRQLLCLCL